MLLTQTILVGYEAAVYNFVIHYGYMAIFLGLFIEGTGMPGPVQILFAAAGYFIAIGTMRFEAVVAVATAGNVAGNLLTYVLGFYGGRALVGRFTQYLGLDSKGIESVEERFARVGGKLVFVGRIFGPVRTPVILSAGLLRLPLRDYILYSVAGASIWSLFWTALGVQIGERVHFQGYNSGAMLLYVGVFALGVVMTYLSLRRSFCRR